MADERNERPAAADAAAGRRIRHGPGLIHQVRPATLALAALNLLMSAWLLYLLNYSFTPGQFSCQSMTAAGRRLCPTPPRADPVLVACSVAFWLGLDVLAGVLWLSTNDRARGVRGRRYGATPDE